MSSAARLRFTRMPWTRMFGLIGRRSYPSATALVFERCSSVHTFLMRMPIDIVFVDREWTAIEVHERVSPGRVIRNARAYAVLELACGEAARLGWTAGTRVYERSARQI